MREDRLDIFSAPPNKHRAICITTNGFVKNNGLAVMGRGCALEAKRRFHGLDAMLGAAITNAGNIVHHFVLWDNTSWEDSQTNIVAFPVKHNWWEKADLSLIEKSTRELVALADAKGWVQVLLPRPGCGNGQLSWDEVRPVIEPLLDERFIVVDKP